LGWHRHRFARHYHQLVGTLPLLGETDMNRSRIVAASVLILGFAGYTATGTYSPWQVLSVPAQAAVSEQTLTFAIENMTCALCPVTVRKAMEKVPGVKSVTVDFDKKTATVVFDPAVATPEKIATASTDVGYPAKPLDT
jgi:mercuric ion binding protein